MQEILNMKTDAELRDGTAAREADELRLGVGVRLPAREAEVAPGAGDDVVAAAAHRPRVLGEAARPVARPEALCAGDSLRPAGCGTVCGCVP